MDEFFKDIVGYEGIYTVSNKGRIFNKKYNRERAQCMQSNGKYKCISLSRDGMIKIHRVHRLVAEAFLPNKKQHVNHKSGNRMDNSVENLEWVTHSENARHSIHVLGNPKPPLNFKGKFGDNHNKSKHFWIKTSDGKITRYGSGREFTRETTVENSVVTYARLALIKEARDGYLFKRGKAKGMILYLKNPHIQLKD